VTAPNPKNLIEGRPVLIVVDIQKSAFVEVDSSKKRNIPHMPDYGDRMRKARGVIDKAHECDIPVVFVQEIHRADLVDFGRELDGSEDIHCLDNNPNTEVAKEEMGFQPRDYLIPKRRYSAFFGTDLEILLRGLKADTLQSDYFCRVIEDCVAGSSEEAHEASLRAMEYLQTGARRSIEEVLTAMEESVAVDTGAA